MAQKCQGDALLLTLRRVSVTQPQATFLRQKCQTERFDASLSRGPEGHVREGFDEFCERSTDSSLTGTFGKRMGHMQMACTVWRRSFPQAQCEKGSPSPSRGLLNGPFLLPLKVYEVEQANSKGNQALSPQAFSLKP